MVMKQADEVAGAPTFPGGKVMGAGSAATMWAGGAAAAAASKLAGRPGPGPSPLAVRQLGYLTATADHVLLLNFKHGLWHPTATGILASAPRDQVVAFEISRAVTINSFLIGFTDGEAWHFQADKVNIGKVRKLAAELGFGD